MNNGWIKLHRKMNENDIMRDANALQLLNWLLLNVDHKTGEVIVQRGWLSKFLKQNPNTFYAVITRLRHKYHMIETTTIDNNQGTKISLLNWAKYQSNEKATTPTHTNVTTDLQLSDNTITRIENKNKEIKKESIEKENLSFSYLENIPEQDVEYFVQTWDLTKSQLQIKAEQLADYCRAHNRKYKDYKAFLRNAVSKDFKVRPMSSPSTEYEFDASGVAKIKALKRQTYEIKTMDHHEMDYGEINERRNYLLNQAEELRN